LYWIENNGKRIYSMTGAGAVSEPEDRQPREREPQLEQEKVLKSALSLLLRHRGLSKITVERWNGEGVLQTEAEAFLRALGAERDRDSLVLWPSQLR
jgi:ATP-dependent Lhr-like helicase